MSFPGKITHRSVAACGGEVQRADDKERNLGLVVITGSPDFWGQDKSMDGSPRILASPLGFPGRESLARVSFPIPDHRESRQFAVVIGARTASGPIDASTWAMLTMARVGIGIEGQFHRQQNTINQHDLPSPGSRQTKGFRGLSCALKLLN
ncbi:hypothetical protein FPOAC2_12543 [Fusarium poae]